MHEILKADISGEYPNQPNNQHTNQFLRSSFAVLVLDKHWVATVIALKKIQIDELIFFFL